MVSSKILNKHYILFSLRIILILIIGALDFLSYFSKISLPLFASYTTNFSNITSTGETLSFTSPFTITVGAATLSSLTYTKNVTISTTGDTFFI